MGYSRISILSSGLVVVLLLFYIYEVGSFFEIQISSLEHRITVFTLFDFHIVDERVDNIVIILATLGLLVLSRMGNLRIIMIGIYGAVSLIAILFYSAYVLNVVSLVSVPAIAASYFGEKFRGSSKDRRVKREKTIDLNLVLNYLAITGIALAVLCILFASSPLLGSELTIRNYGYDIFLLFSKLSSILLILVISCFPVKILINAILTKAATLRNKTVNQESAHAVNGKERINRIIYLAIFMGLASILPLIPHQSFINPDNQQIGVDTVHYVRWVNVLNNSTNANEFTHQAFEVLSNGDRPISLLIVFAFGKVANSDLSSAIEYLPVILGPILVLVVYFLTRQLTSSDNTALLASFLTAISSQILVGTYAGFYANWIALIFGYSGLLFLLKFLEKARRLDFIAFSACMILLFLSHVFTWIVMSIVMGVFVVILFKYHPNSDRYFSYPKYGKQVKRRSIFLILLVIASILLVDFGRMSLADSYSRVERNLLVAEEKFGFEQFNLRWDNLDRAVHNNLGGLFSNFIIYSLLFYWLYKSRWHEISTILVMVFLSIGLVAFILGNWEAQSRVLYDIPFQIPAGIALAMILKKDNGVMMLLPVCLWLFAISLRSVLNFYYVPL